MPDIFSYIFESLKKHGLIAVFLGAIIYIQFKQNETERTEREKEKKELMQEIKENKLSMEKRIADLEIKLLDCQNQRFQELLRISKND
jgi:hypothetical protein